MLIKAWRYKIAPNWHLTVAQHDEAYICFVMITLDSSSNSHGLTKVPIDITTSRLIEKTEELLLCHPL
jgi:hypothetical protein